MRKNEDNGESFLEMEGSIFPSFQGIPIVTGVASQRGRDQSHKLRCVRSKPVAQLELGVVRASPG